jgi:hypothetical protein
MCQAVTDQVQAPLLAQPTVCTYRASVPRSGPPYPSAAPARASDVKAAAEAMRKMNYM